MFGFKKQDNSRMEAYTFKPDYDSYDGSNLEVPEIENQIRYLKAEVQKIESVTGPSIRTQSLRREISRLTNCLIANNPAAAYSAA